MRKRFIAISTLAIAAVLMLTYYINKNFQWALSSYCSYCAYCLVDIIQTNTPSVKTFQCLVEADTLQNGCVLKCISTLLNQIQMEGLFQE